MERRIFPKWRRRISERLFGFKACRNRSGSIGKPEGMANHRRSQARSPRATRLMIEHELGRVQQSPKHIFSGRLPGGFRSAERGGGQIKFFARWETTKARKVEFGHNLLFA